MMLFASPKPFHGHNAIIQRNAIRSWTLLRPACQIILCGNDEGTAETATEMGAQHIPNIARTAYVLALRLASEGFRFFDFPGPSYGYPFTRTAVWLKLVSCSL